MKRNSAKARLAAMRSELGDDEYLDKDPSTTHPVDIYAFGRNFIEECDDESDDDEGYQLVTSGMSDRLMHRSPNVDGDESLAAELIWYVRDLNSEYFANLRWLANLPFVDKTWFGHGHTVPMPRPPLSFGKFKTFLLLPSINGTDRQLFDQLALEDHRVRTLVVHLISDAEYRLVRNSDEGLNEFLDLLDENGYPFVLDTKRRSYA